jgi:transposase
LTIGVDIRKVSNVACLFKVNDDNSYTSEIKEFGVTYHGMRKLCDWAILSKASILVMEAKGDFWHALHTTFCRRSVRCKVVSPKSVRILSTDKMNAPHAEVLATLSSLGFFEEMLLPDEEAYRQKMLNKFHTTLKRDLSRWRDILEQILIDSGLRLDLVCDDIHGPVGRKLLLALLEGKTPEEAVKLVEGKLKGDEQRILRSLSGDISGFKNLIEEFYGKTLRLEEEVRVAKEKLFAKPASQPENK